MAFFLFWILKLIVLVTEFFYNAWQQQVAEKMSRNRNLYALNFVSSGTFYAFQNPWGTTGLNDWRHLSQQIRSYESSTHHAEACVIYEQWRNREQ